MKNENRKTSKTKFLARVMLVLLLLTSTCNLTGCFWDALWAKPSYPPTTFYYNSFDEMKDFCDRVNTNGAALILFDLDDEKSVEKTKYRIDVRYDSETNKYNADRTVSGTFHFKNDDSEGSTFRVDYVFYTKDTSFNEKAKIIIQPRKQSEKLKEIPSYIFEDTQYQYWLIYGLYANEVLIMNIVFSVPLLENENYDERYSYVADMLSENLVIVR